MWPWEQFQEPQQKNSKSGPSSLPTQKPRANARRSSLRARAGRKLTVVSEKQSVSSVEALTTLMLRKDFNDITVREISELADVNRGTFYTHYRDTNDLLRQLEDTFLDSLRDINVTVKRQDWEGATYVYLEEVLTLCSDNADIYKALICTNNDLGFQERFVSTLRNQYLRTFLAQVCRTEERIRDMYCVYIVQGMLAIVTLWLDTGMRETPEQIAQLGGDFIMRGVKGLR